MQRLRRSLVAACAPVLLIAGLATSGHAADFPTKPVRVVMPFAPGGAVDIVTRIISSEMEKILGQPVVAESKPGAFGIIAIEEVARAEPDGHTVMTGISSTNVLAPLFHKDKMKIDYDQDMVPVARIADVPNFFAVTTTNFEPRTFEEFLAYAKANPGKVRYGSTGHASFVHIDTLAMAKTAGIDMIHVPTTAGAAGIIQALTNGDVQVSIINVATAGPLVEAGRVHPIAVAFSERLPNYPDLPTMKELGYPDSSNSLWVGMFTSAKTPPDVMAKLSDTINQALETDTVRAALAKQHFRPVPTKSPEEAKTWIASEKALWERLIEKSGITPQ